MSHQVPSFLGGGQVSVPDVAALVSLLLVLAVDVRLIFYCLDDLNRRRIVNVCDRQTWAIAIIAGGPIGQIAYWLYGRGAY
jgi:hypothetical protein